MKVKFFLIILFFMFVSTETIFAQQREGFIRSSFTHGIHIISSNSPFASFNEFSYKDRNGTTMDIDFVHSTGFTMGLSAMFLSADHGSYIFPVIGISGYTYFVDKWCAGVKMLVTAKHLGLNVNGTYWFFDNMGFGVSFNMLFSSTSLFNSSRPSEGTIFLPTLSWSFKF